MTTSDPIKYINIMSLVLENNMRYGNQGPYKISTIFDTWNNTRKYNIQNLTTPNTWHGNEYIYM